MGEQFKKRKIHSSQGKPDYLPLSTVSKLRKFRWVVSDSVLILLSYLGDLGQGTHWILLKDINKGIATTHAPFWRAIGQAVIIYHRALFLIVCIGDILGSL